jgi:hypothetical protein
MIFGSFSFICGYIRICLTYTESFAKKYVVLLAIQTSRNYGSKKKEKLYTLVLFVDHIKIFSIKFVSYIFHLPQIKRGSTNLTRKKIWAKQSLNPHNLGPDQIAC